MEYRKFNDTIVLRVDPKEEILESVKKVCEEENVSLAEISGLGAVNEVVTGVYNTTEKKYYANEFKGLFEITSLTGSCTRKDGEVYLHLHMSVGDEKGHVFGGHLNKAVVSATAEIFIRTIDGEVGRRLDDTIGLNLFEF